jgi:hypothetical protein
MLRTFVRETSREGYLQASLHKALIDTNHRAATDGERLGNLLIGVTGFTLALIAHQEYPGNQIVLGWSTAHSDHRF